MEIELTIRTSARPERDIRFLEIANPRLSYFCEISENRELFLRGFPLLLAGLIRHYVSVGGTREPISALILPSSDCPFCGAADVEETEDPDGRPIHRCMVCGAFGPDFDSGFTWTDRR